MDIEIRLGRTRAGRQEEGLDLFRPSSAFPCGGLAQDRFGPGEDPMPEGEPVGPEQVQGPKTLPSLGPPVGAATDRQLHSDGEWTQQGFVPQYGVLCRAECTRRQGKPLDGQSNLIGGWITTPGLRL